MFKKTIILGTTLILIFIIQCTNKNAGPDDIYGSLTEAQEVAKKKDKLIMVDFYTDWCSPCKTLDREVFSSEEFLALQDEFVFVRINAEEGEGIDLSKKYKVKGFPTIIFMDSERNEIERILGYRPKTGYIEEVKRILAGSRMVSLDEK